MVEHYDEGTEESKRKSDKLKEKYTEEENLRSNDKLNTKNHLKCWLCEENHTVKDFPSRLMVVAMAQSSANKKEEEP